MEFRSIFVKVSQSSTGSRGVRRTFVGPSPCMIRCQPATVALSNQVPGALTRPTEFESVVLSLLILLIAHVSCYAEGGPHNLHRRRLTSHNDGQLRQSGLPECLRRTSLPTWNKDRRDIAEQHLLTDCRHQAGGDPPGQRHYPKDNTARHVADRRSRCQAQAQRRGPCRRLGRCTVEHRATMNLSASLARPSCVLRRTACSSKLDWSPVSKKLGGACLPSIVGSGEAQRGYRTDIHPRCPRLRRGAVGVPSPATASSQRRALRPGRRAAWGQLVEPPAIEHRCALFRLERHIV